jgi:hypothetical protein
VTREIVDRAGPGEDSVGSRSCEGYWLLDPLGQRLGRIERIFCNLDGDPRYVRIRTGFLGRRLALIPVADVAVDHGGRSITLR